LTCLLWFGVWMYRIPFTWYVVYLLVSVLFCVASECCCERNTGVYEFCCKRPSSCGFLCSLGLLLPHFFFSMLAAAVVGGMGSLSFSQLAVAACRCIRCILFLRTVSMQVAAPTPQTPPETTLAAHTSKPPHHRSSQEAHN
jgi:hypothetical protein